MDVVIFSGTTEGRKLSEYLSSKKVCHDVFVATKSGEEVMKPNDFATVNVGRLDEEAIKAYMIERKPKLVVDATHPYAEVITDNLVNVCKEIEIDYIRVNRKNSCIASKDDNIFYYDSQNECADALCKVDGNIFLTTGSKELKCYTEHKGIKDRVYVRTLPTVEAMNLCSESGIDEKHVIAMYGPHTRIMNEAVIGQYDIKHLVTKESGSTGGFVEKIEAAKSAGISIHIIRRPSNSVGYSLKECVETINRTLNIEGKISKEINVSLVGIGPGNEGLMTKDAIETIKESDYIFGASRMIERFKGNNVCICEYMPDKIIDRLDNILNEDIRDRINIAVLLSGDTGLYSGASKLYKSLNDFGKCDSVKIIPGISSFSAFAAELAIDYRDIHLESIHGRTDEDNIRKISRLIENHEKVFLLMSGKGDFEILKNMLTESFDGEITIGKDLTYNDQSIVRTDINNMSKDIMNLKEGLYIVFIDS